MSSARELLQQSLNVLEESLGQEWLEERSQRWAKHDWKHPVIAAHHFARGALQSDDASIANNEHAAQVLFWAHNLNTVGSRVEPATLRDELRDPNRCEKTLYVIQIASLYLKQGYEVEFNDKPPYAYDFHVVCSEGIVPVECKKKGETERDRRARQNWEELERRLTRILEGQGKAAFIWIESRTDLDDESIRVLEGFLRDVMVQIDDHLQPDQQLFLGIRTGSAASSQKPGLPSLTTSGEPVIVDGLESEDNFFVVLQNLLPTHAPQRGTFDQVMLMYDAKNWGVGTAQRPAPFHGGYAVGPIWRGTPQYATMRFQLKSVDKNTLEVSSFNAFGFRSHEPRDYTRTVVHSLTEVRNRKQLPPDGPGLIFIDVAAPKASSGGPLDPLTLRFDEIHKALRSQLTKSQNERVNALVLTCTRKVHLTDVSGSPRAIEISGRVIEHTNPRQPLPSNFHPLGKLSGGSFRIVSRW